MLRSQEEGATAAKQTAVTTAGNTSPPGAHLRSPEASSHSSRRNCSQPLPLTNQEPARGRGESPGSCKF